MKVTGLLFLAVAYVCLVYHPTEATFALTIGATALTAAEVSALAGLGVLIGAKGLLLGSLFGRRRGRRDADDVYQKEDKLASLLEQNVLTVDLMTAMEPEQCFKRLFCSAATGSLQSPQLENTLNLVGEAMQVEPLNPSTNKYRNAAIFGASRKSIEKCEFHYPCALSMQTLSKIFA